MGLENWTYNRRCSIMFGFNIFYMKFCFVGDFVYINSINKFYYEDKNNRTEHLRSNLRQHLSRWLFLPCTGKSSGGNNQQELLKNEEGRCLQKQTEGSVSLYYLKRSRPGCSNVWVFFISRHEGRMYDRYHHNTPITWVRIITPQP